MPAKKVQKTEADSVYFLKILLYCILGTVWVRHNNLMAVPVGLIVGIILSMHEKFRIDRKIEYAVLLVASLLAFTGLGIFINL